MGKEAGVLIASIPSTDLLLCVISTRDALLSCHIQAVDAEEVPGVVKVHKRSITVDPSRWSEIYEHQTNEAFDMVVSVFAKDWLVFIMEYATCLGLFCE